MPMDGRRRRVRVHAPGRRTRLAAALCALLALAPAGASAGNGANPLADDQPYLSAIGAPAVLPPLQPVLVGVVEAGIDSTHDDLAGRIVETRRFVPGDSDAQTEEHGTATAGLIAAIPGNGIGIDGIAPNARLLVGDVAGAGDGGTFDALAVNRAIRWAADRGARVLNLSLAGPPSRGQQEAIDYAVARGVLVVAAAGNCWSGCHGAEETWPAWLPHVLAVGATADDYARPAAAGFSIPSARWVDIAAPGVLITTLWPIRSNPYAPVPGCAFVGTTACYSTGGTPARHWGRPARRTRRRWPPPPPRSSSAPRPGCSPGR